MSVFVCLFQEMMPCQFCVNSPVSELKQKLSSLKQVRKNHRVAARHVCHVCATYAAARVRVFILIYSSEDWGECRSPLGADQPPLWPLWAVANGTLVFTLTSVISNVWAILKEIPALIILIIIWRSNQVELSAAVKSACVCVCIQGKIFIHL